MMKLFAKRQLRKLLAGKYIEVPSKGVKAFLQENLPEGKVAVPVGVDAYVPKGCTLTLKGATRYLLVDEADAKAYRKAYKQFRADFSRNQ